MSLPPRVAAALRVAAAAAPTPSAVRPAAAGAPCLDGVRPRIVALGDPQASAAAVFTVLERHALLGDDGRLAPDAHLVVMGDFLDWGARDARAAARRDGARLLAWCGVHDAGAITLIVGNHDLSRVGELAAFDDARFARAQADADAVYRTGPDPEAAFLARYPDVPSVECIARDFGAFSELQQQWVRALLAANRFVVAATHGALLLCHAGVSRDELDALGLEPAQQSDAAAVAARLHRALREAFDAWDGAAPFAIPVLHRPGDAAHGEGVGIFYHRPCQPDLDDEFPLDLPPPRRRFDARRLPSGLVQVIGHIRDGKCRTLLGDWCDDAPALDGPVRTLTVKADGAVHYARGIAPVAAGEAGIYFVDGGLYHANLDDYELLDLVTGGPAAHR